jgi:sec-independent protein translocase protein TatB
MFDVSFAELLLIAIVGLLVIGPERLPEALRTLGLWIGRMRRSFISVKAEIEKEIGMDEVRRQLHNEAVMEEMKRIEQDVRRSIDEGAAHSDTASATDNRLGDETKGPAPPAEPGERHG